MAQKINKLLTLFSGNKQKSTEPLSGTIRKDISHMMAIPRCKNDISDPEALFSRLNGADDFSVVNIVHNDKLECPTLYIQYKDHTYLIDVQPDGFEYSEFSIGHHLSDENTEALKKATCGLTFSMQFDEDNQLSFLLMLKVICRLIPDLIGVVSFDSYTLLSPLWQPSPQLRKRRRLPLICTQFML